MAVVRQFMGGEYDTDDYPFVLLNTQTGQVYGRFSTLEKAHRGRLSQSLRNQAEIVMLFDDKEKKFIDWRKKELVEFERKKQSGD